MVILLDASTMVSFVNQPGIAFVHWRAEGGPPSRLFEAVYDNAAGDHPDVRFGAVQIAAHRKLARAHEIDDGEPGLTAFRDGILVFSHSGELPAAALGPLVEAVRGLDMREVRHGLDGGGTRLVLVFRPEQDTSFSLEPSGGTEPPKAH
jgi:hypothetical protein